MGEYRLWRDAVPRPGWHNMAIDRALLARAAAGERWLRLYAWSPACLSFGRHEPAARRYDRAQVEALGLDAVRRPTGGRAVWHAEELTYAVVAPAAALGDLRTAYCHIHIVIRDALCALGAPAELAAARPALRPDSGACFAAAAGGEVMVGDRKVAGSAQVRYHGAMLQHGSILLSHDQSMVARVTRGGAPADCAAPLTGLLNREVAWDEAATTMAEAAVAHWGPPQWEDHDGGEILTDAAAFQDDFRSPVWTWDGLQACPTA
jgi:lipoyl(octanoyl) transferase